MEDQSNSKIEGLRAYFPALGNGQIYFDNAGGAQTLGTVIDSIKDYLTHTNVQLGASYATSQLATARYKDGYHAAAQFLNCSEDQIVFGPSTTQLIRNLSYTLKFQPGDEIVVSAVDHEANIGPWLDLAERQGLVVKWWRSQDGKGSLHLDIEKLLTDKTRLVAVTHASNVLGIVNDIKSICTDAHAVGALVCVDGVAYAPHRAVDVRYLGADFYLFSWYKVFGPHISTLYASWRAIPQLKSLGHYFHPPTTLEGKLGLAAASYELVQAIPHVVDYLSAERRGLIESHEAALQTRLLDYLEKKTVVHGTPRARLLDPVWDRLPTITFSVPGWSPRAVVEELEKRTSIGLRWGDFYCPRLVRDLLGCGPEGVVRVSLVHYNTVEEVTRFIDALDELIRGDDCAP